MFRFIIIPFLILFSTLVFSQDIEVEYQAKYNGLTLEGAEQLGKNNNFTPDEITGYKYYVQKNKNDVENQKILLQTFGNQKFILNLPRSLKSDFGSSSNSGIVSMDLFSEVYSFDEGTVVGIPHGESFAVAFKSDAVNWEISNESKTILGFKCFKAIVAYKESYDRQFARSHTEIWFAPSINKRGGPIVYTNVPGLILEVKLKDVVITASKIKTSKTNGFEKTKKQIISEKQFHKQAAEIGVAIEKRMKN